jgi:hypothetical protein
VATELEAALLARRTKQIELLPKVKVFLDSIARNSIKSKKSYSSGLSLLQNFLSAEEQKQKYERCNCNTILQPLSENRTRECRALMSSHSLCKREHSSRYKIQRRYHN